MRQHGACGLAAAQRTDPFIALTHAIISQQLSTKAAATIAARFDALSGGIPTPAAVGALRDEPNCARVGLERAEGPLHARPVRPRGRRVAAAAGARPRWPDEEVIAALTAVKGIGRWTADMFLMFRLHRPDVLPVGDLGIVKAVQRAYRLRWMPTPERLMTIGEPLAPVSLRGVLVSLGQSRQRTERVVSGPCDDGRSDSYVQTLLSFSCC